MEITTTSLARQYARCRAWIVPALATDPADPTEDDLINELTANRAQLWAGRSAAIVSRLVLEDRGRTVPTIVLWLAGGTLRGVLELQPGIEAWARVQGAEEAAIYARPGWTRVMARRGFKLVGDELRMVL